MTRFLNKIFNRIEVHSAETQILVPCCVEDYFKKELNLNLSYIPKSYLNEARLLLPFYIQIIATFA